MKTKIFTLFIILTLIVMTGCVRSARATFVPPATPLPVASSTPTATLVPTATATATTVPTATLQPTAIGPDWEKLPTPVAPASLPTVLDSSIAYIQPPVNCAGANDPNKTCTTLKGQATDADFVLKTDQAIRLTGDLIVVSQDGTRLMLPFDPNTKQTLWLIVNNSSTDLNLHMTALYGSFRGYFTSGGQFNPDQVVNLRDLAIYQYIVADNPLPTPAPANPTAVWNCESSTACHKSNVIVVIWDGSKWFGNNGLYNEDISPNWQQ